jgi:hypothetical protein
VTASTTPKYVDHPVPTAITTILLLAAIVAILARIPSLIELSTSAPGSWWVTAVIGLVFGLLCYFFWPLYTTYYTLSPEGLIVRYGPWKRGYAWSDFARAEWQRGMFATRIGWPSTTPCVRFTDAVVLRRNGKVFGLYLTPNDSRALLKRISELAPDLTREAIF